MSQYDIFSERKKNDLRRNEPTLQHCRCNYTGVSECFGLLKSLNRITEKGLTFIFIRYLYLSMRFSVMRFKLLSRPNDIRGFGEVVLRLRIPFLTSYWDTFTINYVSGAAAIISYIGFNVTDEACCGLGYYEGCIVCVSPEKAFNNISNHIWWDQVVHPTDDALLADNVWPSLHTPMCYPMNLQDMLGSIEETVLGVNYASAGAGIIFPSGSESGQHISLTQQFIVNIGEDATTDLISNSLFYISIGSNDYIHYYLLNASNAQTVYLPWSINQVLAQTIKQEIKNLYNDKVRKVVVMGLAPIGCAPYYLWLYSSKNGECVKNINDMILEFNFAVRYMVSELNEELVDATIIFCVAFEGSMDIIQNHNCYGFNVTDVACCGLGEYKGWIMCVSPEMACSNAPLATSGGINFIRLML